MYKQRLFSFSGLSVILILCSFAQLGQAITLSSNCDPYRSIIEGAIPGVYNAAAFAGGTLQGINSNDAIRQAAGWLFGPDPNWPAAARMLNGVANLPQDSQPSNPNDVLIFCSGAGLELPSTEGDENEIVDVIYTDFDAVSEMPRRSVRACFDQNPTAWEHRTKAWTSNWRNDQRTIIVLCPWFLRGVQRFQAAAPPADSGTRFRTGNLVKLWNNMPLDFANKPVPAMDVISVFSHTLLHELMHHKSIAGFRAPGHSEIYGWADCTANPATDNQDSLALFGTAVDLVEYCNLMVDRDGNLQTLPEDQRVDLGQEQGQG